MICVGLVHQVAVGSPLNHLQFTQAEKVDFQSAGVVMRDSADAFVGFVPMNHIQWVSIIPPTTVEQNDGRSTS